MFHLTNPTLGLGVFFKVMQEVTYCDGLYDIWSSTSQITADVWFLRKTYRYSTGTITTLPNIPHLTIYTAILLFLLISEMCHLVRRKTIYFQNVM